MPNYYKSNLANATGALKGMEGGNSFLKENVSRFNPEVGANVLRIMPAFNSQGEYFVITAVHWEFGVKRSPVVCLAAHGQICPIDEARAALRAVDPNMAKMSCFRRNPRYLFNVLDINHIEKGVQVWACGQLLAKDILSYCNNPEWGDITDPTEGTNLYLDRQGTGQETQYSLRPQRASSVLPNMGVLENLYDLNDVLLIPDAKEISAELQAILPTGVNVTLPGDAIPTQVLHASTQPSSEPVTTPTGPPSDAPAPPPATEAKPVLVPETPQMVTSREFWAHLDGKSYKKTEADIQQLVNQGRLDIAIMLTTEKEWKTAADYGIVPLSNGPTTPTSDVPVDLSNLTAAQIEDKLKGALAPK